MVLLKDRVYDTCEKCNTRTSVINETVYGCDNCQSVINRGRCLELTIFNKNDKYESDTELSDTMQFCSWKCVIEKLPKIECDYFITLPYLNFDVEEKGQRAKDFFEAISKR